MMPGAWPNASSNKMEMEKPENTRWTAGQAGVKQEAHLMTVMQRSGFSAYGKLSSVTYFQKMKVNVLLLVY